MTTKELVRKYYLEIGRDKGYSLKEIEDIVNTIYYGVRKFMKHENLPDIRLQYLGSFIRRNFKVLDYAKANIIRWEKGNINDAFFEDNMSYLLPTLIRESYYYRHTYVNLYPRVIKFCQQYKKYKRDGKDIPDRGWFCEANRRYFTNRTLQKHLEEGQTQ